MWAVDRLLTSSRQGIDKLRGFSARKILKNRQTCTDGILLNTMPKSGSVYIQKSLAKILNCQTLDVGNSYAFIDQIDIRDVKKLVDGGYVAQNHLAPSPENLQVLQHFNLKVVLHLRDPRQSLLSWVHHLDWISGGNSVSEALLFCTPRPPTDYFESSLSSKINWQIKNYLPQLITWVTRWVGIADLRIIPILITHQEELRTNERALFDSILRFHNLTFEYVLPELPRTVEATHYRLADPTEWKRTFTPDQKAQASSLIPLSLQQRFSWE
jgi:hypothetical protein